MVMLRDKPEDVVDRCIELGPRKGRNRYPLFDVSFYLEQNPDVATSGMNPLAHYLVYGATEGRDPHPLFDTTFYLEKNPDVAASGMNPLAHYILRGGRKGCSPHPLFDSKWYLDQSRDVETARRNPLLHYVQSGWREKRNPHPLFDACWYLQRYPDVAQAGIDPLRHYLSTGWREDRNPGPFFNTAWYRSKYGSDGQCPLCSYLSRSTPNLQQPHPLFDPAWYYAEYGRDVPFDLNPFVDYVAHGIAAGRLPMPHFERELDSHAHGVTTRRDLAGHAFERTFTEDLAPGTREGTGAATAVAQTGSLKSGLVWAAGSARAVLRSHEDGRTTGVIWTAGESAVEHIVEMLVDGRLIAAMNAHRLAPDHPDHVNGRTLWGFDIAYSREMAREGMAVTVRLRGGPEVEGSPFISHWSSPTLMDIRRETALRDAEARLVAQRGAAKLTGPLISILTPVYNVDEGWLRLMVDSVSRQTYANWELCLVDDASPRSGVRTLIEEFAAKERRIKVKFRPANGGISAASNDALSMASGEYVALLDNDDMLTCDALEEMVAAIIAHDRPDWLYSDEFKIDGDGRASQLFAKPDWSPLFLLNYMYTAHLSIYRAALVRDVGGFRSTYDFSQDYDLALRVADTQPRVVHVAKYLYAWRMIEGSASQGGKPSARISNIAALQDASDRRKWGGKAVPLATANRLVRKFDRSGPTMSIVVPSDSAARIQDTISSVIEKSSYPNLEILIVTNSRIVDEIEPGAENRVRFVRYDRPYNFSDKCNVGAAEARGDYVVFFNDDVRVLSVDWMEVLLEVLTLPGVGAAGPKLIYENGLIQHAGMVTGVRRLVGTAFHAYPADASVHFNMPQCVREVSLICGALLAMPVELFRAIGGFDAANAPISHSDVDLCFKVREAGYSCVYTPHATLLHIGHASLAGMEAADASAETFRKNKADVFLLERWSAFLGYDPYFPPTMRDLVYLDSQEPFSVYPASAQIQGGRARGDAFIVSHDLSDSGAPKVVYDVAVALQSAEIFVAVGSPLDGPFRKRLTERGIPVVVDPILLEAREDSMVIARSFDRVIVNTIVPWRVVDDLVRYTDTYWYTHESELVDHFVNLHSGFVRSLGRPKALWSGSQRAAEALHRHGGRPIVLEYGTAAFTKATPRPRIKIVLFGSFEPRKGQDLAVLAMGRLPMAIRRRASLALFGRTLDFSFRNEVEQLARDVNEVEITSALSYERYKEELAAADIVLVPSRDDTLPLVSLDALSSGKPLVCSMTTGTSAYLEDNVSAALLQHNSPEEIASRLALLIEDADLRARIGTGGKAVFQRYFTYDAFGKRLLSAIEMEPASAENSLDAA